MTKFYGLLVFLLASLSEPALAECVWVPACLPPYDPPIDRLRIYLDDQPTYDHFAPGPVLTPWYTTGGKRAVFWVCGRPEQVIDMTTFRGTIESPRAAVAQDAQPPECIPEGTSGPITIGSLFTPTERAAQVLARCEASPLCGLTPEKVTKCQSDPACAIDVNSDGAVRQNDTDILLRVLEGTLR